MIDVERLVRDTLARHEAEVPTPDPLEAHPMALRTRRRQMLNALGAGLIALVIALAATSAIGALQAEGAKPADDPTETPAPPTDLDTRGPFESPSRAPIVVGSGQTKQWPWMLSSSADGRCLGFTDEEGSQVNCSGPSGDPIDAYVYAPRGKTIAFVFGRVPRETNWVMVDVPSRLRTTGKVFLESADSLQLPYSFFVANIGGYYEYPWVPDATISAGNAANTVIASGEPERPAWTRIPFTVIATVASGIHQVHPIESELPEPWEIDIFRDERTGELCLGEPGGRAACGTGEDPVAGWLSTWSSFERVNTDSGPMGIGASPQFMWGVFRDPVASIEIELLDPAGTSPGWQPADAEIYRLPTGYGDALSIFVVDCDCWGVRVHQLAADGSEIGVERIW